MRRSRHFRALHRACAASFAVIALLAVSAAPGSARADGTPTPTPAASPPPPGAETLARAREAWDKGEFDTSEPLYKEALDRGGLPPKDTLDCYVHLGAARVALGRKKDAGLAFRRAAFLDPHFVVPPESGKKAILIANTARKAEAKIGTLQVRADIPDTAPAQKPFKVSATLDSAQAALVNKVGIFAREPASDKTFEKSELSQASVAFEVPASVAVASSTVTVRIDALDAHDNRLVSVEKKVKIGEGPPVVVPVAVVPATVPGPPAAVKPSPQELEKDKPPPDDKNKKKGGGFWASPWPYVLGGVALAAGGAAVYLGTRPTDDVSVGAANVRVR